MAAPDRRRAILEAVIPLLLERGSLVTTAEMAEAAGIAEGTIFRVFPDKPSLIYEAVKVTLEPADIVKAVRAIGRSASMREQLVDAANALVDHFKRVTALVELLPGIPPPGHSSRTDGRRLIKKSHAAVSAALIELIEPHQKELRVAPSKAIAAFRGLIFASGHPMLPKDERLSIDEVVSILLAGIRRSEPA